MTKATKATATETAAAAFAESLGDIVVKAQGIERVVNPTELAPATIAAMTVYGARRWYQDNINSAAHAAKQESGKPVTQKDAEALFDARHAQAVSGEFTVRGSGSGGFTERQSMIYAELVKARDLPAFRSVGQLLAQLGKDATTADRKAAVLAWFDAEAKPKARDAINALVDSALAARDSLSDI